MADISTKLKQLRSLYSKMPEGGGKQAVAQKIAKLEASQPKEVVEVKEEVKEEVIKKPKAPKKTSKGKEMRHVFEKKVDGGKEIKVVMATSVDLAKEAMQESGFDYNRTISRGRSPKEGFVASGKPKKIKETKGTKRPTKATRDEMAKAAGMTPEKAEKVAKKVSSAKKRGRKPAKHNSYLFEMPMKTQAGKVKRKVIVATSEESAQKQAGRNYTFIKELKAGEKPKTGIQSVKDFVAPPPKKRGRRPRPKTQAEMDRMSDLYSKLGKKVKGQKSKKSKVAKKPKAPKYPSKSADSSIEFTALKKLAEEVTDLTEQLSFRVQVLNGQIEKFRNYEKKYAKGGAIPKGFDLENAEEIRGDETLDEWVRDSWGDGWDWSLSKDEDNYELVEDAVAMDDEGNVAVFYVFNSDEDDEYAKGGRASVDVSRMDWEEIKTHLDGLDDTEKATGSLSPKELMWRDNLEREFNYRESQGYEDLTYKEIQEYEDDEYAKGGKTQKEHTFSYRIYDESGDEIDGGSIKMMGEDRETAYNKAVTSIEEGLNEGEEVEVSKLNYEDRFKKGFEN